MNTPRASKVSDRKISNVSEVSTRASPDDLRHSASFVSQSSAAGSHASTLVIEPVKGTDVWPLKSTKPVCHQAQSSAGNVLLPNSKGTSAPEPVKGTNVWPLKFMKPVCHLAQSSAGSVFLANYKGTSMVVKFAIQRKKNNRNAWEYCEYNAMDIPRNARLAHREYKVIRRLLSKPGPGSEHIIECFYSNASRAHVDGVYYNAQEYGGDCLVDLVASGTWNIHKSYTILRQMANALAFIQKRGYVHHDVKPDNILFKENFARLIDFAGCLPIGASENLHIAVTPGYMPPEWNTRPRTVETDEKFDIYSLGVMFMLLRFPATQTIWLEAKKPVTDLNLDSFMKHSKCSKQDRDLLEGMLCHDYTQRWTLKKLQFMCDLMDSNRNRVGGINRPEHMYRSGH